MPCLHDPTSTPTSTPTPTPTYLTSGAQGRNILQFPKGAARSAAIRRTARFLCITLPPASEHLQAEVMQLYNRRTLRARRLETHTR